MSRSANPRLNGRLLQVTARHGQWLRQIPELQRNHRIVRGIRRVVEHDVAPRKPDSPLTDSVFVRMDDELAGRVAAHSGIHGVSMNTIVRTAIDLEMNG